VSRTTVFFVPTQHRGEGVEATHCEFSDINWGQVMSTSRTRTSPSTTDTIVFRTKTGKSRKVIIEPGFLEKLRAWHKKIMVAVPFPADSGTDKPRDHYWTFASGLPQG